jgi:hypothetical protein
MLDNSGGKTGVVLATMLVFYFGSKAFHASEALALALTAIAALTVGWWALRQ